MPRGLRISVMLILAGAPILGCHERGPDVEVGIEEFKLAVDVDLEAAVMVDQLYAVGSNFVAAENGAVWEFPQPLHDIESVNDRFLVVVGDGGFVALAPYVGRGDFQEFTQQPTGIDADFFGVVGYPLPLEDDLAIIAVGDNAVGIGTGDPASGPLVWTTPQAPPGGWGVLRSIRLHADQVCALGDSGTLFCAEFPNLSWEPVNLDTDARTRFCEGYRWEAAGMDGTYAAVSASLDVFSDWLTHRVASFDIGACSTAYTNYPIVVGANRTIYRVLESSEPLLSLDWQPLAFDSGWGKVLVGEGGHAAHLSVIPRVPL